MREWELIRSSDSCLNNPLHSSWGKSGDTVANLVPSKDPFDWQLSCLFFCSQAETLLAMKDQARDLASAGNLLKKHQLLETEMLARNVSGAGIPLLWDLLSKNGNGSHHRRSFEIQSCKTDLNVLDH